MDFTTENFLVNLVSDPNEKKRCYWITSKDGSKMIGTFLVSVDKEVYNNICVLSYTFGEPEKEIFKEVFVGLAKNEQLPVYFKAGGLDENLKALLREIEAEETVDADEVTVWYEEENCPVFKLQ